jgi:hypothetical protein
MDATNEGDIFLPEDGNSGVVSSATVSTAFVDSDKSPSQCKCTLRAQFRESVDKKESQQNSLMDAQQQSCPQWTFDQIEAKEQHSHTVEQLMRLSISHSVTMHPLC